MRRTGAYDAPLDFSEGTVQLAHGSGGRAMAQLIDEVFVAALDNPQLAELHDCARLPPPAGTMVIATDSHVVSPLFFPGGDIGSLAVNGTINDVAMSGARPLALSSAVIVEEGFPLADLRAIAASMAEAAAAAGVPVITGDTKVVERGKGDGIYITTTGVGVVPVGVHISGASARPGDAVIVSGPVGDHGVAVMKARLGLTFEGEVCSDSAALHGLVSVMVAAVPQIRVLRDPTRGGLAATLNEICDQSRVGMLLREAAIPIREAVRGTCELIGLDPLQVACEGRLVAICAAEDAASLVEAMRQHPLGAEAQLIGTVTDDPHCFVQMTTCVGGQRIVDWPSGEQLPRIC